MLKSPALRGLLVVAGLLIAGVPATADLTNFNSASFWDGIPHTLIDFETEPDGTPLDFPPGSGDFDVDPRLFEPLGVVYGGTSALVVGNDSDPGYDAVLATIGSLDNSAFFLGGNGHESGFRFIGGAYAFSMSFIINENLFGGFSQLRVVQFDPDAPLDPIILGEFSLDEFITGRVDEFAFGVFGFVSDVPIDWFTIMAGTGSHVSYDDLRFRTAPIPAPGGAVVMMGALTLCRRRR